MKINIDIDTAAIHREVVERAQNCARNQARNFAATHFNNGSSWGQKKGEGYLMIENALLEKACSDDLADQIKAIVDREWDGALERAVKYAVERKARKVAQAGVIG